MTNELDNIKLYITAILNDEEIEPAVWAGISRGLAALITRHFGDKHWPVPPFTDTCDGVMSVQDYINEGMIEVADWAKKNLLDVDPEDYARRMRNRFLAYLTPAYAAELNKRKNEGEQFDDAKLSSCLADPSTAATAAWQRVQAILKRYPTPLYAWLERAKDARLRLVYKTLSEALREGRSADQILLKMFSLLEGQRIQFPTRVELLGAWYQALLPLTDRREGEMQFTRADIASLFDVDLGPELGVVETIPKDKRYKEDEVTDTHVADELLRHFKGGHVLDRARLERNFRQLLLKKV